MISLCCFSSWSYQTRLMMSTTTATTTMKFLLQQKMFKQQVTAAAAAAVPDVRSIFQLLVSKATMNQTTTTTATSICNSNTRRYYSNFQTTQQQLPYRYFGSLTSHHHHNRNYSRTNETVSSSSSPPPQQPAPTPTPPPFVPMTPQQEEQEKLRVSQLSSHDKDVELRQYNRQIATLEMKRGINTGELYTYSGRYKALARDYGMPLMVWYWAIWGSTGLVCFASITLLDIDVVYLLQQIDIRTGYAISEQVNPEYGKIGLALLLNEIIEPIRLPIVIMTVKPVIDKLFPTKY